MPPAGRSARCSAPRAELLRERGGASSACGRRALAGAGAAGTAPCSSRSRRNATDSRARSAAGRVTFTSASSSGRRGSPPWRMSSTATASRSIKRSTVASPIWFACASSRSRVSSVTGIAAGTSPRCCTSISWRRCSSRSITKTPEIVPALGQLLDERQRTGGVAVDHEVAKREERLLLDRPEQLEHRLHRDRATGGGGELVERRLGVAVRAARAARDECERLVGHVDALGVGDQAELLDEILQSRPLEDERLAARAHGRQHLRQIRRAEDEDEVRRRLLDELQKRVPRCVRQLVRLVEDVDLVAPLDRLEHDAVADLADVVDAALRRCVHLHDVERRARRDRRADVARPVGRRRRAGRAVERLREDPRHRRLAGAARAGEEIRLADGVAGDRVAQCPDDRLLPDHVREALGTVFPVEGGHKAMIRARPTAHLEGTT